MLFGEAKTGLWIAAALALAALWVYHQYRVRRLRQEFDERMRVRERGLRHDLLSPLNAVAGYLELLGEESGRLTEEQRRYVEKARGAYDRTMEVLDTFRR